MNLKKFHAIASGYFNYAFPTPTMKELAEERARICSECPQCEPKAILKVILPDQTCKEIEGAKCMSCGCPLSAKVRQLLK